MKVLNSKLPYLNSNPRSVRGAKRRGWTVVRPNLSYVERTTWLGLCIWCDIQMQGYFIPSFLTREFAFEHPADATAFALKWQ